MFRSIKFIALCGVACWALHGSAMPTRAQFQKALPLVREILADDNAAVQAKSMKPAVAGDHALKCAQDASLDEASRYLFFQAAYGYYVRAADYVRAESVVGFFCQAVKDLPDAALAEFIERPLRNVPPAHGKKLHELLRAARARADVSKKVPQYLKQLKAKPSDALVRARLAAARALLGNWPAALDDFAKCAGDVAAVAAAEAGGDTMKPDEIGDFWWHYLFMDAEFESYVDVLDDVFKAHAALWYKKALARNDLPAIKRQVVARRLKEAGIATSTSSRIAEIPKKDVAGKSDVSNASSGQKKIEFDLGQGVKMEFMECPAGTFFMGNKEEKCDTHPAYGHTESIARPFYMAKYDVTDEQMIQYERIFQPRDTPFIRYYAKTDPGNDPTWEIITSVEEQFHKGKHFQAMADKASFVEVGKALTERFRHLLPTGYVVRMPTAAEIEYAYRAGQGVDKKNWLETLYPYYRQCRASMKQMFQKYTGNAQYTEAEEWRKGLDSGCFYWPKNQRKLWLGRHPVEFLPCNAWGISPDIVPRRFLCDRFGKVVPSDLHCARTRFVIGPALEQEMRAQPKQVGQKKIEFDLGQGVKMHFLECPAGTFFMGDPKETNNRHPLFWHKVTITRPFYMTPFAVTVAEFEQLNKLDQTVPLTDRPSNTTAFQLFGASIPMPADSETFTQVGDLLTKRFRRQLPPGYVVRLPTHAEFEYAWKAGQNDGAIWDYSLKANEQIKKEMPKRLSEHRELKGCRFESVHGNPFAMDIVAADGKRGTLKSVSEDVLPANKWGFRFAYPLIMSFLDRVDHAQYACKRLPCQFWNVHKNSDMFHYANHETDPLLLEGEQHLLYRPGAIFFNISKPYAHLVIGPDLEREKRAQKK